MFGCLRFPVEKRAQLFGDHEVIKGWRLLADCKYLRYVRVLCCCYTAVCATRNTLSNMNFSIFTLGEYTAHVGSTLRLFCSADRYQASDIRCSKLLIPVVSRILSVLRIECDNAHTVRVLLSQ